MLRLEGLTLVQGDFRLRADWTVPAGTRVALIGPSGAGKSTLLNGIAGFLAPQSGRVTWDGRDIGGLAPGRRPIAMLFQDGNLFPHLSVARNVGLGIRPDLRLSAQQKAQVAEAIRRVGLEGMDARRPAELSGGQQSRAALARVLVQRRPLLLLDEPFAALGPALRAEMLSLVDGLCRETGATLLMVSHAPEDARRIADSVVLVDEGIAEAPVATAEAFDDPSDRMRRYLG
ncbi:thiamine ABC transporter ATP-binding protein [Oceanicola sp. 22II-s10i]|uniref:thiamine ABC transporter ATP-binding protein n=1 Tax=Oceanicola sp. 22II-s10i TaxID=1317116 RepID=UPI000B51EFE5|nr:thiamine ABC transporter ATP-binding protein [Oceanicola sp. 22II-s10i]OWU86066.1 thiamine ABC transporter ATP-binding protein [Oceanicola sp. 22II-s10i]